MQVHQVDPLHDARWVRFVQNCPHASVFHTREWLDSIHRTYGYEPVAFSTSPPTEELRNGLIFCRIRSWLTGPRMVSLPFSDHCEPLFDSTEELDFVVNCLQKEMEHQDWNYLEIRPIKGRFDKEGQKAGFRPSSFFYLHRLDLRRPLEDIFRSLHKDSAQRRIRRAERAGVSLKCGRSEELLKDFYHLLVLTRGRHNLPPQPYVWFRNLVDCMGESLELRLAYKGTLPIAALLILRFRNTIYYKYGCSNSKFHNFGAMSALFWRTIQESKTAGFEQFDLGRTEIQNTGLIAFKNHWAHEPTPLSYWRYPCPDSPTMDENWKLRVLKRACARMPNRLLAFTGRLMYRHIG
jgi:hypothetical protein